MELRQRRLLDARDRRRGNYLGGEWVDANDWHQHHRQPCVGRWARDGDTAVDRDCRHRPDCDDSLLYRSDGGSSTGTTGGTGNRIVFEQTPVRIIADIDFADDGYIHAWWVSTTAGMSGKGKGKGIGKNTTFA